jgi:ketosteroid isomerase-like protein
VDGQTSKLVRLVLLLYAAGDVQRLLEIWHPDLEIVGRNGSVTRGDEEIERLTRYVLEDRRIELDPETVRISGPDALIDGFMIRGGRPEPATWLWSFRDGRLWRSVMFERDALPVRPLAHATLA